MIFNPLMLYGALGAGVVVLGLGIAVKVQSARLESCKVEHAAFVAQTKAEGDAAEARRQKDINDRKAISDRQEAASAKRYASLEGKYHTAVLVARGLPVPNSSGGEAQPLSGAATVISCPDRSADVARSLEQLEVGVLALLDRGNKGIERSITCKAWLDEQITKQ